MIRHWRAQRSFLSTSPASRRQRGAPLLKTDLIDLLSSPVIPNQEVPTWYAAMPGVSTDDRDWTDFP